MRLKRSRLPEMAEIFADCSKVTMSENDGKDAVDRFKYACGKNWRALQTLAQETKAVIERMQAPSPAFGEFQSERDAILREFAVKDDDGKPVTYVDRGVERYKIAPERMEDLAGSIKELGERYDSAVKEQQAKDKAAEAYADDEIDVPLFTVPWACVPDKVPGTFRQEIAAMFTDPPAWMEKVESHVIGTVGARNPIDPR